MIFGYHGRLIDFHGLLDHLELRLNWHAWRVWSFSSRSRKSVGHLRWPPTYDLLAPPAAGATREPVGYRVRMPLVTPTRAKLRDALGFLPWLGAAAVAVLLYLRYPRPTPAETAGVCLGGAVVAYGLLFLLIRLLLTKYVVIDFRWHDSSGGAIRPYCDMVVKSWWGLYRRKRTFSDRVVVRSTLVREAEIERRDQEHAALVASREGKIMRFKPYLQASFDITLDLPCEAFPVLTVYGADRASFIQGRLESVLTEIAARLYSMR